MAKKILLNLVALLFGLAVACIAAEIVLRVVEPVPFRVRGTRIQPQTNLRITMTNTKYSKMDRQIIHTRNSLGFRGENPPLNFDSSLTMFAIGGSTTECYYLSDGKTWPEVLGQRLKDNFNRVWINNAGLDGHSTFGHTVFVRDYIAAMRPKLIMFMIGVNDVGRAEASAYEKYWWNIGQSPKPAAPTKPPGFFESIKQKGFVSALAEKSDLVNLLLMAVRSLRASKQGLGHGQINFAKVSYLDVAPDMRERVLAKDKGHNLELYAKRVTYLIKITRAAGIVPVLITQPALWGPAKDPETGVDLGRMRVGMWGDTINGAVAWARLEQYNEVTRRLARELKVFLVDAGREMPKNTKYYYDYYHFTNEGAQKLAGLIARDLCPYLARTFPKYQSKACSK